MGLLWSLATAQTFSSWISALPDDGLFAALFPKVTSGAKCGSDAPGTCYGDKNKTRMVTKYLKYYLRKHKKLEVSGISRRWQKLLDLTE